MCTLHQWAASASSSLSSLWLRATQLVSTCAGFPDRCTSCAMATPSAGVAAIPAAASATPAFRFRASATGPVRASAHGGLRTEAGRQQGARFAASRECQVSGTACEHPTTKHAHVMNCRCIANHAQLYPAAGVSPETSSFIGMQCHVPARSSPSSTQLPARWTAPRLRASHILAQPTQHAQASLIDVDLMLPKYSLLPVA